MKSKRTISNQEFDAARTEYKEYIDNVSRGYASSLSPEALQAAGDMALWRCLQAYDARYGQTIRSSLYRFIHWECLRTIREQKLTSMSLLGDVESSGKCVDTQMMLEDYLSMLPDRERRIVEARFLENRTFDDIARRESLSKQGIKDIVDKSISVMSEAAHA
jgi:DNA-directed RNA polymerase specialized sigma24 family protein